MERGNAKVSSQVSSHLLGEILTAATPKRQRPRLLLAPPALLPDHSPVPSSDVKAAGGISGTPGRRGCLLGRCICAGLGSFEALSAPLFGTSRSLLAASRMRGKRLWAYLLGIVLVERALEAFSGYRCLVSTAIFSNPERSSSSRIPRGQSQMSEVKLKDTFSFPPEPSLGKIEYKLRLTAQEGTDRFEELVTQLNWRMRECSSLEECEDIELSQYRDAIYRLGVSDDGQVPGLTDAELAQSLSVLKAMASRIPATVTVLSRSVKPGNRSAITALVRACQDSRFLSGGGDEVRICTVGNVDSGKSTLLGVLTEGLKDDGRGRARAGVFRHRHELETGRTSSIATSTLGFDQSGQVVNYEVDSQKQAERGF